MTLTNVFSPEKLHPGNLAGLFSSKTEEYSASRLVKVLQITTDKSTLNNVKTLNTYLDKVIKMIRNWPYKSIEVKTCKTNISGISKLHSDIQMVLDTISGLIKHGYIILDGDKLMMGTIEELKIASSKAKFIFDMLTYALEVKHSTDSINSGKAEAYTQEQLEELFAA